MTDPVDQKAGRALERIRKETSISDEELSEALAQHYRERFFREPPSDNTALLTERVIGERNFLPAYFLEVGAEKARAVARISYGRYVATGFLVAGDLLLTNNHVIGKDADLSDYDIEFNYQLDLSGNEVDPDIFKLELDGLIATNERLDYTLVRVKKKIRSTAWLNNEFTRAMAIGSLLPDLNLGVPGPVADARIAAPRLQIAVAPGLLWGMIPLVSQDVRVVEGLHLNIVQHPQGRRKEIALQDNEIDRLDGDFINYTTDTEPGSSGSPVFNNRWELVALHHSGGDRDTERPGRWLNNRGTVRDALINDLHEQLGGTPEGDAVLVELGLLVGEFNIS